MTACDTSLVYQSTILSSPDCLLLQHDAIRTTDDVHTEKQFKFWVSLKWQQQQFNHQTEI